jgi:hypothetical protein
MKKKTYSWREYNKLVASIAQQITISGWRPDYIVGITRGGLPAAVMLSHYFNVPMHSLGVSLRDATGYGTESNCWMSEDAFGYVPETYEGDPSKSPMGKKILIVDDINDSGATINWIVNDWQSSCLPNEPKWKTVWNNNVRFAVVIDNLASKATVCPNYVGESVNKAEEDVWIEFPYESWWRI